MAVHPKTDAGLACDSECFLAQRDDWFKDFDWYKQQYPELYKKIVNDE